MTSGCSVVESGTIDFRGYEDEDREEVQPKSIVGEYNCEVGSTLERMQEEEALLKAVMPHLRRAENRSAALKRIETVLEKVNGHQSDETFLECIQILAPVDLALARKCVEKIQNNDLKVEALVTLAAYQGDEDARSTLLEAEALCSLDNLALITQVIDEAKKRGFAQAEKIFIRVSSMLNNKRTSSIGELEFMHHFQMPGFKAELEQFHRNQPYLLFADRCRLLQLEVEIDSPLKHETLNRLRTELLSTNWGVEDRLKLLLPIEGRVPAFREEYLKDLWFLYQQVPSCFTYLRWGTTIDSFIKMIDRAPLSFLERLYEHTNLGHTFKPYIYLELLKGRQEEVEFSFKDESQNIRNSFYRWNNTGYYVDLFIRYAQAFGVKEAQFLLDMAIEEAYWYEEEFGEMLVSDIVEERRTLSHYGAKLFGLDSPHPRGEEDFLFTKLSKVSGWEACELLKAYVAFNLPGIEELLHRAHQRFETKSHIGSDDALNIIRAEIALLETESK